MKIVQRSLLAVASLGLLCLQSGCDTWGLRQVSSPLASAEDTAVRGQIVTAKGGDDATVKTFLEIAEAVAKTHNFVNQPESQGPDGGRVYLAVYTRPRWSGPGSVSMWVFRDSSRGSPRICIQLVEFSELSKESKTLWDTLMGDLEGKGLENLVQGWR